MDYAYAQALSDALAYYHGDAWRPKIVLADWYDLLDRLHESGYTAYEFAYFAAFHMMQTGERMVLQRANVLRCQKTWDAFMVFKQHRTQNLRLVVEAQRRTFQQRLYLLGGDLLKCLLDSELAVGAPVRIDLAAAYKYGGTFPDDSMIVVWNHYRDRLEFLVRGSPEYLPACPWLSLYIEELSA